MLKLAVRLAAFAFTVWCWRSVRSATFSAAWEVAIMWGGVGLVPLVALAGRYLLDHRPHWIARVGSPPPSTTPR